MLERVRLALRIKTKIFDLEIKDLINAALKDLELSGIKNAGVENVESTDPLIIRAVITYCAVYMGPSAQMEKMKAAYDEQKAQLKAATGYGFPTEDKT